MNARQPTGTLLRRALSAPREVPLMPLDSSVPCPGGRYGKAQIYRATLLAMKGDDSFVVKDATQVYAEAKKIGVTITTRKTSAGIRVWRLK
jgi:hypothetical protein